MTENEAIKYAREYIKYLNHSGWEKDFDAIQKLIVATEEIQQYRAIGTVEDIRNTHLLCEVFSSTVRDYTTIGTVEEFKALKGKNVAKKVEYDIYGEEGNYPYCECGSCLEFQFVRAKHCPRCGQKLDWERKE